MEKFVLNGYRDCTVLLDGTECKVTFDHCYRAFAVMNDSTEDVFVSIEQEKSSGEDGVRRIAPGCSSVIAHMRTDVDTVYITGSGSVQISAQNGTENPFKPQSGGGDTTINGNVVTPSAVNGNIKIDGVECRVYDDSELSEAVSSKFDKQTEISADGNWVQLNSVFDADNGLLCFSEYARKMADNSAVQKHYRVFSPSSHNAYSDFTVTATDSAVVWNFASLGFSAVANQPSLIPFTFTPSAVIFCDGSTVKFAAISGGTASAVSSTTGTSRYIAFR